MAECKNPECGKEIPENMDYCSGDCLRRHIELKKPKHQKQAPVGEPENKHSSEDGSTGSGGAPTHTYSSVGTFTVSLMVTDVAGNNAASSSSVTVEVVIPEFSSSILDASVCHFDICFGFGIQ